ncbi:hypothetical protein HK099_008230 [Clydaea vesicula]|uniref:Uncharacterized protein n=1 Tax=Clydaea vesicula TaxID=447962 RepID=A0AAD5XVX7_9FUNG|nr:hypothetical protein HK099_008230 [Clydaea vesicula]
MHISVVNYADNQIVYDVDNILLVNHVNIQKTYIYATVLDENFEVIDNFRYLNQFYPRILDIKQPLGDDLIGPHDTRTLIDNGGNIIITFNMDDANGERLIWTFNITTGELRKMYYELALGPQSWIGFVNKKNEVQFIYSWEPKISILNCNSGSCIEIMSDNDEFGTEERDIDMNHPETLKSTGIKKKAKSLKKSFSLRSFRGGSSLTSYKDYYISLVRIRSMDPNNSNAPPVFRSRLAILDRNFAIVFISENLDFQNLLFLEPFFKKTSKDPKNFFCSYASLLKGSSINKLKNGLDWVLEFSINDQKNVLVVVKNLTPFFDSIIQKYEAGKFSTWNIRDLVDDELHNIQWCSGEILPFINF